MMRKQLATLLSLLLAFTYSFTYSADYYWVNNSGNWSDASHWANSSGGAGGFGIPGESDVVHFDENSFSLYSEVNMDGDFIIKEFQYTDVSETVWFKDYGNHTLQVKGDFFCTTPVAAFSVANLLMSGKNNCSFNSAETVFTRNIEFTGKYELEELLATTGNDSKITISKGEFVSNDHMVYADILSIPGLNTTVVDFGTSEVHVTNAALINESSLLTLTNNDAELIHPAGLAAEKLVGTNGFLTALPKGITLCSEGFQVDVSITSNYNGASIQCNGDCNGEITVVPSDTDAGPLGSGGYSCQIVGGVFPPGGPFTSQTVYTGLCAGSYTITCMDSSQVVVPGVLFVECSSGESLIDPFPITFSATPISDPSCPDSCDGEVFISANGGTSPLTIVWQPSLVDTNRPDFLCVGQNLFTITDNNGCTIIDSVEINDPPPFVLNIATTPLLCNGVCAGTATTAPTGGSGPPALWTYDWNGAAVPVGDGTQSISALCAGPGTLSIVDTNGCPFTDTYTITEPPILIIDSITQTDLLCNGACIGTAEVLGTNSGGAYGYQWLDGVTLLPITNPGNATSVVTSLCAGTYVCEVTDGNGCIDTSVVFTITEPPVITFTTTPSDATCFGTCDGQVAWTSAGGTGIITSELFLIGAPDVSQGFVNPSVGLCPGDYYVIHTDANLCVQFSDTVTINSQPQIVATTSGFNPLCALGSDGADTVNITGGIGPFGVNWFDAATGLAISQVTNPAVGLSAGCYYAVVTDLGSISACSVLSDTSCLIDPLPMTFTTASTDVSCFGACDGTVSFTTGGGTGVITSEVFLVGAPDVSQGFANPTLSLCPGDYYVLHTDGNSCTVNSDTVTITEPTEIIGTTSGTDPLCGGSGDGTASLAIVGGAGGNTWQWEIVPATNIGQDDISPAINLGPGCYYAVITDGTGCVVNSDTTCLTDPPAITFTTTAVDATCSGTCDGQVSFTVAGGAGGFTSEVFLVGAPDVSVGFANPNITLCAGDYYVVHTDANLCVQFSDTVTVNEPLTIVGTTTGTDPLCNGGTTGQVTLAIVGGTGAYTWGWELVPGTPVGAANDNPLLAVGAGCYYAVITDAATPTCIVNSDTACLIDPPLLTITTTPVDEQCFNACDGSNTAVVGGGTGVLTTSWTFDPSGLPAGPDGTSITGLCADDYTATVTDGNGCTATEDFTINPAPALTNTVVETPVSCTNACDGSAIATPVGGTGGLTVSWEVDPTGASAGPDGLTISNLCPGDYWSIVTDGNLCQDTASFTLTNPVPLIITTTITDETCFGDCDGQILVNAVGGTGGYTFQLDNGGFGPVNPFTALCQGTYDVSVQDASGCSDTLFAEVVGGPTEITLALTVVEETCFGDCDGSITVVAAGGAGGYSYTWSSSANTTSVETGLCVADSPVTLTVTDGSLAGCFSDSIITFTGPAVLTAVVTPTDPVCAGGTGSITIDATGGVILGGGFDYDYSSDAGATFTSGVDPFTFSGLLPGSYDIVVQDLNGCQYTETVVINTIPGCTPTTTMTPESCGGGADGTATVDMSTCGAGPFTHQWYQIPFGTPVAVPGGTTLTITGLTAACYFDSIVDLGTGCVIVSDTICVAQNPLLSVNVTNTDVSCNGLCDATAQTNSPSGGLPPYTYDWYLTGVPNVLIQSGTLDNIAGLCAVQYFVELVDANGCVSAPVIFTPTENPALTAPLVTTDPTCALTCDGIATVAPAGGDGTYTVVWDNITTGSFDFDPGAVLSQTALCAGDYQVTVLDGNGCSTGAQAFTLTDPVQNTLSVVTTDETCFGANDGTAIATPSAGTGPFTFAWTCSTDNDSIVVGLAPGACTVAATDALGCATAAFPFNTAAATEILATLTPSTLLCNGDLGSIAIAPTGGSGAYDFLWDASAGAQTTNPAINLAAGTYCVDITDQNNPGCTVGPFCATIVDVPAVTATSSTTNTLCAGVCTGTATVVPSGGTGAGTYSFLWDAAALNQSTPTAINLCAGTYSCTITDGNGCSIVVSGIVVTDASGLTLSIAPTNASCFGGTDGQALATVGGGTGVGTYNFQWDPNTGPPAAGQIVNPALNLAAGTYGLTVTDGNGCTISDSVTVGEGAEITGTVTTTPATCGLVPCDGSATIAPLGGTPLLTQQWFDALGAPLGTGTTESTLCAGAYTVVVTDLLGCNETFAAAVSNPAGEVITTSVVQDVTCAGGSDGIAEVSYVCSTGPLDCTVQWDLAAASQITDTATGLAAGTYVVTVTNANTGCISTAPVTITDGVTITLAMTSTPEQCFGACDGTATATPSGGHGLNYTYLWDVPAASQVTQTAFNLCGDATYGVVVTDSLGCTAIGNVTVDSAVLMTVATTFVDASCDGSCDGIATALPTGGTGGTYTYAWDDAPTNQTTASATGLCVGTYICTVTDSNGCSIPTAGVVISAPAAVTNVMTSTQLLCNGDSTATATATPSGGSGVYTYNWQQGGVDLVPAQTTQTAVGLPAGTYTVQIFDVPNNCALVPDDTVVITVPAAITSVGTTTPELCDGDSTGTATVVPGGGAGGITVVWDPTTGSQVGPIASGLTAGTYIATLTDLLGCTANDTVTVTTPGVLNSGLVSVDAGCFGDDSGTATVTITGGTPGYDVTWSTGFAEVGVLTSTVSNLAPGNYSVALADLNGCVDTTNFVLTENDEITGTFTFVASTCTNSDGSLTVTPGGGTSGYNQQWLPPATGTGTTTSGLPAGTYDVEITDAVGCVDTLTGTISDINAEALAVVSTDESCFGACDGELDATSACVDGPCTIDLLDNTGTLITGGLASPANFPGLCAAPYIVQITNNSGCITFVNDTVSGPGQIFANPVIVQPTCSGAGDGSILLTGSGGTGGTFSYSTAMPMTGLIAGTYGPITITDDGNGCTLDTTIILGDPTALSATEVHTDPLCFTDCNGTITVTATGGSPGYTYSIDAGVTFQASPIFTGLCDGSYNIIVMDAALPTGCTFAINAIVLTEPALLVVTPAGVDPQCFGANDGQVSATAVGGSGPYVFTWDGGLGSGSPILNVLAGTYNVTVTDSLGCTDGPSPVTITDPPVLDTTASGTTDVLCNGDATGSAFITMTGGTGAYTYTWGPNPLPDNDTVTGLTAGTIFVIPSDANGCIMDTVFLTINEPAVIAATTSSVDATCLGNDGSATVNPTGGVGPGYSFQWDAATAPPIPGQTTQTATNLAAGSYNVIVTDTATGCNAVFNVAVSNVNAPTLSFDLVQPVSCFGGNDGLIDITISGGTPGYNVVWSPDGQTTEDIFGLEAGLNQITITDGAGCILITDTTIFEPTDLNATFAVTDATCGTIPCNGQAVVTVTGGTGPGTYSYLWSSAGNTDTETGLCAGLYDVLVTDGAGCSQTFSTPVNDIGGPTSANVTANPVSCFGGSNGDATVTAIGGTSPYSYIWTFDNQGGDTHLNLPADDYFVQIIDSNNCLFTQPLTITEPPALLDSAVFTPPTCTLSDGEIEVFINGGTPTFSYNWIGTADNDSIHSAIAAGIYQLEVTQGNGCIDTLTYNLSDANAPVIALTATDVLCNDDSTGTITSVITGGTIPYTPFNWTDGSGVSIGQLTQNATNLWAGDFTLQVTDGAGCISFQTATVEEPDALVASVPSVTDASCNNACNGVATAIITGGSLPFNYSWTPGGQNTANVTDLCVGINDVLVTDNNGCELSQSITINEVNTLAATVVTTDAACGVCDGDATVTPTGGSGTYTVSWSDGFVGFTQDSLCAGVYSYDITDSDGCMVTLNTTINNPEITGETVNITDASCFGALDGAADVNPIGGTSPYTYLWVPGGSTTNAMTGLGVGTYNVEMADSNGCIRVVPVTISSPTEITISTFVINSDCGLTNGAITVFPSGGLATYTYSWPTLGGTSNSQSNVPAGTHDVIVTDSSPGGCSATFTIVVNSIAGPNVTATATDVGCFGACDGTGTAVATGGSGTFSFAWSSGGAAAAETNLCPGTHLVTVTDLGSGCITSTFVTVTEADSIAMSIPNLIDASCGLTCDGQATIVASGGTLPYTYGWPAPGIATDTTLCAGTITVTVTDNLGCTQTQDVTINEPTPITIVLDSIDASCTTVADGTINGVTGGGSPGYSYTWTGPSFPPNVDDDTVTNLLTGMYTVTVQDSQGCSITDSIMVNTSVVVLPIAGPDTSFCTGTGAITLTGTGTAVTFEWFDDLGNQLSTADTVDITTAGCYVLLATDGLCTNTDTICVTVNALPIVDAGTDQTVPTGTSTVIGGSPTTDATFNVIWIPSIYLDDTSAHNPNVVSIDSATSYIVMVTDSNGCVGYDTVLVDVYPDVFIPSGFTPNGDGLNDDWELDYMDQFPEVEIEVYNRWGQQLFYNQGYTQRWDGTYNGKDLPEGTYYYVIKLNHPIYPEPYTGPVTIMR